MADETLKLVADFSSIDAAVARMINEFGGMAVDVIESLHGINDYVQTQLVAGFNASMDAIKNVSLATFEAISTGAKAAWAAITGGASYLVGFIGKAFSVITAPITAAFNAVKSVVTGVFTSIWGAAKTVAGVIGGLFVKAGGLIKNAFSGIYGIVKDLLPLAGIGLFAGLSVGLKELQATEQAFTRVKAAVAATGGVAGFTTDQLKAMADQMAENTRFGDDLALAAQAVALQFKNVRGDVFKQALELSADAAIAWGTDLTAATDKVARALDDPLEGFRVLKSEGVKFNEQQKMMIEQMLRMGNVAGAQKIILEGLRGTVGGQAAADVKTFSGAIAQVNNAMGDAWKAIAGALVPALKPLVEWFKKGAEAMAAWAPVLGQLVNDTIAWANQSSGVLADWGKKAQEIFMQAFDFAVDAATRAFTFIETAIKDFPGFMNAAKAKFNLYWEEIKQFATHTWESISVAVQNIWEKLMVQLAKMYTKFIANVQRGILGLRGGEFILGKNKAQVDAEERAQLAGLDRAGGLVGKRKAKGQTEEEKKTLDELRKKADETGGAFGDKFGENLKKNQAKVDAFKQRIANLLGLDLKGTNLDPNNSGDPFAFNKEADTEDGGSAGKFEDLLSLQKRITGAASQQSPETKELSKQTQFMILQHKETIKKQDEVKQAIEKNKPQPAEVGLAP